MSESLDLSSMVEESLDNVADAPEFVTPPAGQYTLKVMSAKIDKYKSKDDDTEKQRIKHMYQVVKTHAVANPSEQPVPDNSMFSETFNGTEQGLGYFKTRAKHILNVDNLNGVPMNEIFSSLENAEFNCTLGIKKSPKKDGSGDFYENVQIKVIPPTTGGEAVV